MRGSSISSCTNSGTVNVDNCVSTDNYIGGITGLLQSKENSITDCHNTNTISCGSSVSGRSYLGGITGGCNGASSDGITIDSCTNSGSVINNGGASDIGGIAGQIAPTANSITVTISNCTNSGAVSSAVAEDGCSSVSASYTSVGGIAGQLDPKAANNHNTHLVTNCKNTATGSVSAAGVLMKGKQLALGGIVANGTCDVRISSCTNEAKVSYTGDTSITPTAQMSAGGILGIIVRGTDNFGNVSISDCINRGDVVSGRAYSNFLGGIVANTAGVGTNKLESNYTVTGCKNYGAITKIAAAGTENSGTRVGGLFGGASRVTCTNCANYGSVSSVTGKAGAIMGGSNVNAKFGSIDSEANSVCNSVVVTLASSTVAQPALGSYYSSSSSDVSAWASGVKAWFAPGNDAVQNYFKLVAHSSGE